jgi:hypothetical protein
MCQRRGGKKQKEEWLGREEEFWEGKVRKRKKLFL